MAPESNPKISAVICAFSLKRFDMIADCIYSILNNTYKNYEIILVIDGNRELKQKIESKFKDIDNLLIIENMKNEGASISRNKGIEYAKGDIVAFIDDDAYTNSDWLEHIVNNFNDYPEILVVGGKLIPVYEDGSNKLPEEILWIVGGTYKGHPEHKQIVRNVFTGNMAVRRSSFKYINFETMYDKKKNIFLSYKLSHQLEDTLFCVRLNSIKSNTILYDPDMIAYHHVPKERLGVSYIFKESFFEGIMKAKLEHINGNDILSHEHNYLNFVLVSMIKDLFTLKIVDGLLLLLMMCGVLIGYLYSILSIRKEN